MRSSIKAAGVAVGAAALAVVGVATPSQANTGGSCTAPIVRYPQDAMQAFAYHKVKAIGKVCLRYTGPGRVQFTRTPAISFPETSIGGGVLEQLSLKSGPTVIRADSYHVTYEFIVHQTVLHVPGGQDFTFRVHYTDGGHQECMIAGTNPCSTWKAW